MFIGAIHVHIFFYKEHLDIMKSYIFQLNNPIWW